jgi:tetratricopeptide (TPR) repeat protein
MGGETIHGLQYVADEWGGTPAGKVAALFLGNSHMALGELDKAVKPYETATGSDSPLVRAAAHAGLAAVKEEQKKYEDAAKEFETAASEDRSELNTAEYLLGAARNYEQAGKKNEAVELYRRIATQYPNSSVNAQVHLALARHNVEL